MRTLLSIICLEVVVEKEIIHHVEVGLAPARRTFQVFHTLLGTSIVTNAKLEMVTLKTMEIFFR